MIRLFITGLAALGLTAASAQTATQPTAQVAVVNPQTDPARAWGFATSDVPTDPEVRYGVLPNGMKYALRRNTTPRSVVLMRLQFDIGSLQETDAERGIAHFLEHMAFNGSANVPEGTMLPLLERNGLAFGADTNAATGFETTSYLLNLPTNGDGLIDTGLMLFGEIAQRLTIAPEAVDRERGIIQSERRVRDNYGLQNLVDQLEFALAGTLVPSRLPSGTEQTITAITADQIRFFYDRHYRPERATIVVVGDFDVDAMEARILAQFSDWRGRGDAAVDQQLGALNFARPSSGDIFVHPAIAETVTVAWFKPWALQPDTLAQRRQDLLEAIGEGILRRRFARITLAADAPIIGAGFSDDQAFDLVRSASVTAQARDGQWRIALGVIEQELRRAMLYGFSDAEIAEQVAGLRTAAANAVAGRATRDSGGLAANLLSASDGRRVVTTPEFRQQYTDIVLDEVNGARVSSAFLAMLANYGDPLVRVTSKQDIDGGGPALIAALGASTRVALAANDNIATAQFAYTDFGPAGTVVADDRIADLDIRRVRFANGVMLNIKRTDFEDDRVRMEVRVDGGGQLASRDNPTRVSLAPLMALGGLQAHSADELRTILAGRSVAQSFTLGNDAFGMGAVTTPQDMLLQAQLFAATLSNPGYRPEAISLLRRVLPGQYAAMDATPGGALGRDISAILTNDDPLSRTPSLETMMGLDWAEFRAVVADSLDHGAIEVGIVGDVDETAAIAAIAATLGALPERRPTFIRDPAAFERRFAQDLSRRTLLHRGEAEQAIVQYYWPARDDTDLIQAVQLELLGGVMRIMFIDELREHLGQTYSPDAGVQLSSDYPGYGYIHASASVARADIASVEAAMTATTARLRDDPIPADVLDRARQPVLERITQSRRQNAYWLSYVVRATSQSDLLDQSRHSEAAFRGVTLDELSQVARRYLLPERLLPIRVVARDIPQSPPAQP